MAILGYVNHTVNDGDFTGLRKIPFWDEVSIHDGVLPRNDLWGIPEQEWFMRNYNVLNKMLWSCEVFDSYSFQPIPPAVALSSSIKNIEAGSWRECKELWKKSPWLVDKIPFPNCCHMARKTKKGYQVIRAKTQFRLHTAQNKNKKIKRAYDLYIRVNAINLPPSKSIFFDKDHNAEQGCLYRVKKEDSPSTYSAIDVNLGDYDDITIKKPKTKNTWHGWSCTFPENIFAIFRYDVAGGFEFVPPKKDLK